MQSNRTKVNKYNQSQDDEFFMSLNQAQPSTNKDQTIRLLEDKNQRLRSEVNRIDKILDRSQEKVKYGNKIPQIRSQVIDKELDNAYKLIKFYDYQVKKLKNVEKEGSFAQQIFKIEQTLKQRQQLSEKLKKELLGLKKDSIGIVKQLKNDNKKEQNEEKKSQINKQIKWLREKIKENQTKRDMLNHNAQQQMILIKKFEKDLENEGYSKIAIEKLKQKYAQSPLKESKVQKSQEIVQQQFDRSPQTYLQYMAEIKLLQKLQKSHGDHIQYLKKELQEAYVVNLESRNRLLQIQDEIDKVENRIDELKPKIDPRNMKPQRALSVEDGLFGKKNKSNLIPIKPPKPAFPHSFKFQEVGSLSKAGRRFSDRGTIGKFPSKIIAIDFYTEITTKKLIGLQVTYLVKETLKKSNLNMIIDKKKTSKTSCSVSDREFDYYRSIDCYSDDKTILVGLSITSNNGQTATGGILDGSRRPLSISRDECPGCFYGSFSQLGIQLFGAQISPLES